MSEPRSGSVGPESAAPGRPPSLARIATIVLRSGVLPGTGHLATGHRRSGWLILGAALLLLLGCLGGLVAALSFPATAASLAVRPTWLNALRWGAPVLAAAWAAVIVSAAVLVHPGARGGAGRTVAAVAGLVMVAVVVLPAAVVTNYADVQLNFVRTVFHDVRPVQAVGSAAAAASDQPLQNGRLNVLLVGSDAGPDRTGVRTDSVLVASVDTRTGRTVLFTLPRNLERVPFATGSVMAREFPQGFSCGNECLLNAIYRYGVDHASLFPGERDPGITALRSGVTATLGIPIDYYALLDLAGFQKLVDALGGVTIRVERRLPIGGLDAFGNHVEPSGHIEPGLQHMNGDTALAYARSRSDSSDYERVLRQRCLLGAIQRQADPTHVLANFQQIASSTADALQTDIPRSLLPDLVKLAFKVKSRPIEALAFTPPLIDVTEPDVAAIHHAVLAAIAPPPPTPTSTPGTPSATAPTSTAAPTPGATLSPPATAAPATPVSLEQVCSYQ